MFPGLRQPSFDVEGTRSHLRSSALFIDIDLSTARSLSAGSALLLPVAGNTIYADHVGSTGIATVYFEDATRNSTPVGVSPGFVAKLEYTQLAIENAAQPSKKLRLIYGVDLDFLNTASKVYGDVAPISTIGDKTQFRTRSQSLAVIGDKVLELVSPAENTKGMILRSAATLTSLGTSTYALTQVVAAKSPTGLGFATDSANEMILLFNAVNTASLSIVQKSDYGLLFPPGWGMYLVMFNIDGSGSIGTYYSFELL